MRYLSSATACVAFMLMLAAVGLAVEYLAGIGGLAVLAGVFVVVLLVAVRSEGLL